MAPRKKSGGKRSRTSNDDLGATGFDDDLPLYALAAAPPDVKSLIMSLPLKVYPFNLMPLIADFLKHSQEGSGSDTTTQTYKLGVFPAFAPFCEDPLEGASINTDRQHEMGYAPTFKYISMFKHIILPTRFGRKEGHKLYFPQPPCDDEVRAFYMHPEVQAALPEVSPEDRALFGVQTEAFLHKSEVAFKMGRIQRVTQGGCWIIHGLGKECLPHVAVTEGHPSAPTASRSSAFAIVSPSIPARSAASGAVSVHLAEAARELSTYRQAAFACGAPPRMRTYSDVSLFAGMEKGMYGGYSDLRRGTLYMELWWGWGKPAKLTQKNPQLDEGKQKRGVPIMLHEDSYLDDARCSPHSRVVYLPGEEYSLLAQEDGAQDEEKEESDLDTDAPAVGDTPANDNLKRAQRMVRKYTTEEIGGARPPHHLRHRFPIGSLATSIEVQADDLDCSQPQPPVMWSAGLSTPLAWSPSVDAGLSSLLEVAYMADNRPVPQNLTVRFVEKGDENPNSNKQITVYPKWGVEKTDYADLAGGLQRSVSCQVVWDDLPIPPPLHLARFFPRRR